jgi:signal peptidase II
MEPIMDDKPTKPQWSLFISITVICFFLDLLSKLWTMNFLHFRPPIRVVGQYLQLMLVYNKGALFGFNPRHYLPWFPLNAFFFVFSILAILVIVVYFSKLRRSEAFMRWGLMLILPGALGNLFDRIIHPGKGVVDFIRVGVSETVYWPIFNLADVYVTIGVALVFINFYLEERRKTCKKNL